MAIFYNWDGGLGIYGAIVGGLIGVLLYTYRNKLNLLRYLDIGAPALLIGQAIGWWGNFANQELYGPPTTLPWGIGFDYSFCSQPLTKKNICAMLET